MSQRRRAVLFGAVSAVVFAGAAAYVVAAARDSQPDRVTVSALKLKQVTRGPFVAFLTAKKTDAAFDRVVVAPLADPGRRVEIGLRCDRLAASRGGGICLRHASGVGIAYTARFLDAAFRPYRSASRAGIVSRARISVDGKQAAATSFIAGHSYAQLGQFSTLTVVFTDGRDGENLESWSVRRGGAPFERKDRNFWGVTYTQDGRAFYATMGTRQGTYLVRGDVARRTLVVVHENAECPSLSPDGTKVAYKKRVAGGGWRFNVLTLASGVEVPLAEKRSIDDQLAWLDDKTLLYGVGDAVWTARVDGTGTPRVYLARATSPTVVQ